MFNHNIETVPDLYRNVRPGADYQWSLTLLQKFKAQHPEVATKSGIMLGLGETMEQVQATLRDLRAHDVDMITIGQYLQPSAAPPPGAALLDAGRVQGSWRTTAWRWGSPTLRPGPLVRSSYHADRSAAEAGVAALA